MASTVTANEQRAVRLLDGFARDDDERSELATLDEHPASAEDQPPSLRDKLLTIQQLRVMRAPVALVEGLLYADSLAQMSGPPGCYKTFLHLGLACAVSAGASWEGHHVPRAAPVLYVAAEGASGLARRIDAWSEANRTEVGDLFVLPEPLQLGNAVQVADIVNLAAEMRPGLVVFDTRARCTLGLEENSATEQGVAIEAAERIRRASGSTVSVVHHSGRTGDHGRGSTAWDGAAWTLLRVTGSEQMARIKVEKHKDAPDGFEFHYRMLPHLVGQDRMPGEPENHRRTLVAVQSGPLDEHLADQRSTREVLDILRTAAGSEGLTRPQIVDLAAEQGIGRSTAYIRVNDLLNGGAVRNVGTEKRPRYVPSGQAMLGAES